MYFGFTCTECPEFIWRLSPQNGAYSVPYSWILKTGPTGSSKGGALEEGGGGIPEAKILEYTLVGLLSTENLKCILFHLLQLQSLL